MVARVGLASAVVVAATRCAAVVVDAGLAAVLLPVLASFSLRSLVLISLIHTTGNGIIIFGSMKR